MRKLVENLTLFFIGVISETFGIIISEIYPIFTARSEILLSLIIWTIFLTVFMFYKVEKYSLLGIPIFIVVFLSNYYYVHPTISLIFDPIVPILPLILILVAYLMKIYGYKGIEFILRSIALSFLGICIIFVFWISLFL